MKLRLITLAVVLTGVAGAAATAQMPPSPAPEQKPDCPAVTQEQFAGPKTDLPEKDSARAEAYYNFTMRWRKRRESSNATRTTCNRGGCWGGSICGAWAMSARAMASRKR